MKKNIALIPAYNPDEKLITLIDELKENKFTIIVINDGSDKKSDRIFDTISSSCHLISHKNNLGKGAALKTGLSYIKNNYDEYIIVTMDADGQHTVDDAKKLIEYNKEHTNTLVLGRRYLDKSAPLKSKIGNAFTRKIYQIATKTNLHDTQTGLRAFSNELVDLLLKVDGDRYEYEMNALLTCVLNNIPIHELTIKTIYIDNNASSHFNPFKDSIRIFKSIIKFSISSLLSFLIDFICYTLFLILFKNISFKIQLSNVLARLISGTFNYNMNKKFVFKKHGSLLSYIGLAIFILIMNTCLLTAFTSVLSMNALLSKIIVECLLFLLSYIIQKYFIFNKGDNNA